MAGNLVKSGSITVGYGIYEYEGEDGPVFDVILQNGDSPDNWFETIEDAENWAQESFD